MGGGAVSELLVVMGLVLFALVGFVIFFIFKQIQFVLQAVNLYKDMINRLDNIIEILTRQATSGWSNKAPTGTHDLTRQPESINVLAGELARARSGSYGSSEQLEQLLSGNPSTHSDFLEKLGYTVIQKCETWTIKSPNGIGVAYAYSEDDLRKCVRDIAIQHQGEFSWEAADTWKCRCGEVNPVASILCSKCGRAPNAIV